MTQKIWFITGASRGFGREWAIAALERGDSVAATARDLSTLDDLSATYGERFLPLRLDVTDRDADFAAVRRAHERFGRLDVVVNNAGYGHFGMVEEITEAEARAQLETNLFGALWVTQAALPFLREQGSGHILQVSSIGGISAFPLVGIYHASKWALEGISQSLAQEVAPFGIKVTLIEPGGFATDWGSSSSTSQQLRRTPSTTSGCRHSAASAWAPRGTRRRPPRPLWNSWTPPSRPCAASSARPRWASRRPTTNNVWRRGRSGSRWRSWPRAERCPDGRGGRTVRGSRTSGFRAVVVRLDNR
ncbi:SDR family NAD(P)-dependent oxidoreductase [Streptomyces kaempferi]